MRLFLIEDETGSLDSRVVNEQGLIDYANNAHFVEKDLSKPINEDYQVYACNDVEDAICILQADLFWTTELNFDSKDSYTVRIG